jgi:hypothetical protein
MPDLTTTATELPYGGTVDDLRRTICGLAAKGEKVLTELLVTTTKFTDEQALLHHMAHGAAFHGAALAAVLGYLAEEVSPEVAQRAAEIVQDIGMNGDLAEWCTDVWPGTEEAAPVATEKTEA